MPNYSAILLRVLENKGLSKQASPDQPQLMLRRAVQKWAAAQNQAGGSISAEPFVDRLEESMDRHVGPDYMSDGTARRDQDRILAGNYDAVTPRGRAVGAVGGLLRLGGEVSNQASKALTGVGIRPGPVDRPWWSQPKQ